MKEFYRGKRLNLAHRGASHVAPENTLSAFKMAMELGADGIELDVMLSKDGEVIVIHDYEVDRTTDGHGFVKDMTLSELKGLDAGSWFDPKFAGERIPTLQEVIDLVGEEMVMNIELKTKAITKTDGLEAKVAEIIAENDLYDSVIVSSFNPFALWRIKRADGRIRTGLLYAEDLPIYLARAWLRPLARPDALHPKYTMVDESYMRWAKARGYYVNVWTVDDENEMKRLLDLGVDGIITNRPELLKTLLR